MPTYILSINLRNTKNLQMHMNFPLYSYDFGLLILKLKTRRYVPFRTETLWHSMSQARV